MCVMKNKLFLLFAMLFLALTFSVRNLSAQTAEKMPVMPKTQTGNIDYQNASAVFVGEVVSSANGAVKFNVRKNWKGKNSKEIKISAAREGENCVNFEIGKTYLVYLSERKAVTCSKTKEVEAMAAQPKTDN